MPKLEKTGKASLKVYLHLGSDSTTSRYANVSATLDLEVLTATLTPTSIASQSSTPTKTPTATATSTPTPTPTPPGTIYLMFVSSVEYKPEDIGSPSNADTLCQGLANAASLSGTWSAFVSYASRNASTLLPDTTRPIKMHGPGTAIEGGVMATSASILLSTGSNAVAAYDQAGNPLVNNEVWTGSSGGGDFISVNNNCQNYTSNSVAFSSNIGNAGGSGTSWLAVTTVPCNSAPDRHIYCVSPY